MMALLAALGARSAWADDRPPLNELLPHDTLVFAEVDPAAGAAAGGNTEMIDLGLKGLATLGILPQAGVASDILGLVGEAGGRRICIALLDADLHATPQGGLECRSVQLAWVVDTPQPQEMVDRITHLLEHYAAQSTAEQSLKTTPESHKVYIEFHDKRWPAWLTLAWTELPADHDIPARFILTLGAGAMEHYLADRPVGDVPWKQIIAGIDAKGAAQGLSSGDPLLARLYVSVKQFRERFDEPMHRTTLGRMFGSLDLQTADGCVFTARKKDRSLSMFTGSLDQGRFTIAPWTISLPANAPIFNAVPADATVYAVLNVQWPGLYDRVMALCDAIVTGPTDTPVARQAQDLTLRQGVDIRKDILDRLQPLVLIHDSPRHPLGIPGIVTAVAAAHPGSEEKLKLAMTRMTQAVSQRLDAKNASRPEASTSFFSRARIRTDSDGISYIQFGLVGPAWGWVGNRLIVSWSPGAVRINEPAAGKVTSEAFSPAK